MRLIGFVNEGADIKKIFDHIGEPSVPPKLSQDRDPPLWDTGDAAQSKVFDAEPDWAIERQISPEVQFDQSENG